MERYLARHFGDKTPLPPPGRAALAELPTLEVPGDPAEGTTGADAANGERFYKIVCASCHGPAALGTELGPALANRAVLSHAGVFEDVVQKGLRKMPAMTTLLDDAQRRDILGWLRGLPRDAAPAP